MILTNAPQRVNAIGDGRTVATWDATPVDRPNIEAAAREGYLDGLADRGFSRHYDSAPAPWQRNYEIGRLWAVGIKTCDLTAPDWPADRQQQPAEINGLMQEISRRIGALRPETDGVKAPADLPTLHEPLAIPRRLLRRVK